MKEIIKEVPKYKYLGNFSEGLAAVMNQHNKYGFINKKGEEVIKCQFDHVHSFSNGLAAVLNNERLWGYIGTDGEIKIPFQFENALSFRDGVARVLDAHKYKYGYINETGSFVIEPKYVDASNFISGYAIVKQINDTRYSLIDKTGKVYGRYNDIAIYPNGTVIASKSKEDYKCFDYHNPDHSANIYYKIDKKNGEQLIPTDKLGIQSILISTELVPEFPIHYISKDKKSGYLGEDLNIQIPAKYLFSSEFKNGVASVNFRYTEDIIIDKTGKTLFTTKDYSATHFSEGLMVVRDVETFLEGCFDRTGKLVIPCIYKKVNSFSQGVASVRDQNDNLYYIDQTGKKVIDIPNVYKKELGFLFPYDEKSHIQVITSSTKEGIIDKCKKIQKLCEEEELDIQIVVSSDKEKFIDKYKKLELNKDIKR